MSFSCRHHLRLLATAVAVAPPIVPACDLQWKTSALDGDGFSDHRFQETQNHVFYAIFGEPLPPWKSNPDVDPQNAWTNALDFAIAKTVTNLVELAEIVCDTLSPPAEQ